MKLSIFPKCKPHPASKQEKDMFAQYVSYPHESSTVDVHNDTDLVHFVSSFAWSPFVFNKYRNQDNFISTDLIVLDVDQNLTIEKAEKRCDELGYCFLILPTVNHTENNHRFRIVFPLVRTITNPKEYRATWKYLQGHFPELDPKCSDLARFYYASTTDNGCFQTGKLLEPSKVIEDNQEIKEWKMVDVEAYEGTDVLQELYGETPEQIPETVDFFLQNAHNGLPGEWICSLNAFVFTLTLQGVESEKIVAVIKSIAPEELDKRDNFHIKNAIRDANNIIEKDERYQKLQDKKSL